ncbi:MAG: DeoR/GlpR family DNA-binding transcription regulator [Terriglobia bacterium]|jgi:DeoR family transcriptional regulator of aga operon
MLNEERRRKILAIINEEGRGLVKDLASRLDTSQVTVRKDLDKLHGEGVIQRSHGGALPVRTGALLDPSLQEKEKQHRKEKQRIGDAAAALVKEGDCVVLDSGTTTTVVARALRNRRRLTVITNAVNIAAELAGTPIEVILTGGILRENSFSLVGPLAEETLGRLSADIFFLAVDGFDVHYGPTTPNLLEAKVNREMSKISRRTVCVCDSSKFGRRSLSQIITISSIHQVITDNRITAADLNELTEAGIKVTVV